MGLLNNIKETMVEKQEAVEPVNAPVEPVVGAPVEEVASVNATPVVDPGQCGECAGTGLLGDPAKHGNRVCTACQGKGVVN